MALGASLVGSDIVKWVQLGLRIASNLITEYIQLVRERKENKCGTEYNQHCCVCMSEKMIHFKIRISSI